MKQDQTSYGVGGGRHESSGFSFMEAVFTTAYILKDCFGVKANQAQRPEKKSGVFNEQASPKKPDYGDLRRAILGGKANDVRQCLRGGVVPRRRNIEYAAMWGEREILSIMLEAKRKQIGNRNYKEYINAPGKDGQTLLHHAALSEEPETVECLLSLGADHTITDDKGQTPYDIWMQYPGPEVRTESGTIYHDQDAHRLKWPEDKRVKGQDRYKMLGCAAADRFEL
jgi:hypothetical protein